MPARAKTYVARESFAATVDGEQVVVHAGERYAADHPLVASHAHAFAPEDAGVKQAPPPTRRARRPRRKADAA